MLGVWEMAELRVTTKLSSRKEEVSRGGCSLFYVLSRITPAEPQTTRWKNINTLF